MARQVPPSMGFPRQEYWSGLPFPPPGDLPDSGIKPGSPTLAGGFFTTEPATREAHPDFRTLSFCFVLSFILLIHSTNVSRILIGTLRGGEEVTSLLRVSWSDRGDV